MDLQFRPGSSSLVVRNVGKDVEYKGDFEEPRPYAGRSAGGKLRTSHRNSKKATPYDRPTSGRHATAGGLPTAISSMASSSSLTSRLLGSASRLISSSANYFFPYLFGQRTLGLTHNNPLSVQEVIVEEKDKNEESEPLNDQNTEVMNKNTTDGGQEQFAIVYSEKTEKPEFDLARVEDMLRQKSWSREQASRLTDLLSRRLTEHSPTVSRLEEAGVQSRATQAVDLSPQRGGESMASPPSEAQRWREEFKRARTDCVPVEVARAYMGERASSQLSLAPSFRGSTHQVDRVAELQPPPGLGLTEDRYRSLPVLKSRTRSPATHMLTKGPILNEEWMSVGPVRRTRHKRFHMNLGPYARALPAVDSLAPRAYRSPPVQSSQTARKILDTLEMLSPSPKSKYVNDEHTAALTSDMFSVQGSRTMQRAQSSKLSSLRDTCLSNGRLESGSLINSCVPTPGTKKNLVGRLRTTSEAGLFSSSAGLSTSFVAQSSSATSSTTSAATFSQPEITATAGWTASNVLSPAMLTSANVLAKADAPSSAPPGKEEQSGTGAFSMVPNPTFKDSNKFETEQKLKSFQFGSPPFNSSFNFQMGSSDASFDAKGLPTASRQDGALGSQSESAFSISQKTGVFISPLMLSSRAAESSITLIETRVQAANNTPSSFDSSLFRSLPGSTPVFKAPPSGELFSAVSIAKPTAIPPLTAGAASAPFTFSPSPASVSCSTPTFSFASKEGFASVFAAASLSKLEESNSTPVFNFTSPSGGPKLFVVSEDIPVPAPTFSFGAGASLSASGNSLARTGQLFSSGTGTSALSGGLATESGTVTSSFVIDCGGGAGSQQSLKLGGQSTSDQLVGSLTGSAPPVPFSTAESLQAPSGLEAPVNFTSGLTRLEKSGRRIIKAKRKK